VREISHTPTLGISFLTALKMASALGRERLVRLLLMSLTGVVVIEDYNETELVQGAIIQCAIYGESTVVAKFLNFFKCSYDTIVHVLWAAEMTYPAVFARYYLPAHEDLLCANQYHVAVLYCAAAWRQARDCRISAIAGRLRHRCHQQDVLLQS
jgi:hypothetical protein